MRKLILSLASCAIILWTFPSYADWGNNIGTQGLKWASIATATTTVIKNGFTFLGSIIVTGGASGTITVFASGSTVSGVPVVAQYSSTNTPNTYVFNANLASGCTVVTGAATDITVTYL